MLAIITTATTFGLTAGVAGGIGFQALTVARLAIHLVRERLRNENA